MTWVLGSENDTSQNRKERLTCDSEPSFLITNLPSSLATPIILSFDFMESRKSDCIAIRHKFEKLQNEKNAETANGSSFPTLIDDIIRPCGRSSNQPFFRRFRAVLIFPATVQGLQFVRVCDAIGGSLTEVVSRDNEEHDKDGYERDRSHDCE